MTAGDVQVTPGDSEVTLPVMAVAQSTGEMTKRPEKVTGPPLEGDSATRG